MKAKTAIHSKSLVPDGYWKGKGRFIYHWTRKPINPRIEIGAGKCWQCKKWSVHLAVWGLCVMYNCKKLEHNKTVSEMLTDMVLEAETVE